jgi:hypothetical protein
VAKNKSALFSQLVYASKYNPKLRKGMKPFKVKKYHDCGPDFRGVWPEHNNDPVGTVWQCPTCKTTWVAWEPYPATVKQNRVWAAETRMQRRRRLKGTPCDYRVLAPSPTTHFE